MSDPRSVHEMPYIVLGLSDMVSSHVYESRIRTYVHELPKCATLLRISTTSAVSSAPVRFFYE